MSVGLRDELGRLADAADDPLDTTVTGVYLGVQSAVSEGLGLATASPFGLIGTVMTHLRSGDVRLEPEDAGGAEES